MKTYALTILCCTFSICLNAQSFTPNTSSYFLNPLQLQPMLASNGQQWIISVQGSLARYEHSDDNENTIGSSLSSIEGYIPQLKSAVYLLNASNAQLKSPWGHSRNNQLNAGISPRFDLGKKTTILVNLNAEHYAERFKLNEDYFLNDPGFSRKTDYLNAGAGIGLISHSFFLLAQYQHMFSSYAFRTVIIAEDETINVNRGRMNPMLRLNIGKSIHFSEHFMATVSAMYGTYRVTLFNKARMMGLSFSDLMKIDSWDGNYATGNLTAQYKQIFGGTSFSSNEQWSLAIGLDFKQRLKVSYSVISYPIDFYMEKLLIHNIGITYNITKPNKDNQLLPLVSMF